VLRIVQPVNTASFVDPRLRASNEGSLRPRVARAKEDHQAPSPPLFRKQEDD